MNPIFIGANIQNIHHLAHTPPIFYTKTRIKYIFKKEHPLNAPLDVFLLFCFVILGEAKNVI